MLKPVHALLNVCVAALATFAVPLLSLAQDSSPAAGMYPATPELVQVEPSYDVEGAEFSAPTPEPAAAAPEPIYEPAPTVVEPQAAPQAAPAAPAPPLTLAPVSAPGRQVTSRTSVSTQRHVSSTLNQKRCAAGVGGKNCPESDAPDRPSRFAGGLAVMLLGYMPALVVGYGTEAPQAHYLYYPVAGPWLYLAHGQHETTDKALLVFDGIIQDIGAFEILISMLMSPPKKNDTATTTTASNSHRVHISPRFSRYSGQGPSTRGYQMGLSASGRF
jgi:hypothetical protein